MEGGMTGGMEGGMTGGMEGGMTSGMEAGRQRSPSCAPAARRSLLLLSFHHSPCSLSCAQAARHSFLFFFFFRNKASLLRRLQTTCERKEKKKDKVFYRT
jgi:hypothetical protein